jgi:hypothetical protein
MGRNEVLPSRVLSAFRRWWNSNGGQVAHFSRSLQMGHQELSMPPLILPTLPEQKNAVEFHEDQQLHLGFEATPFKKAPVFDDHAYLIGIAVLQRAHDARMLIQGIQPYLKTRVRSVPEFLLLGGLASVQQHGQQDGVVGDQPRLLSACSIHC